MNSFSLVKDIQSYLEDKLSSHYLRIPSKEEKYRPPKIFIGQLPARAATRPNQENHSEADLPFVLIRATSTSYDGLDENLNSETDVSIICGIHSVEGNREEKGVEDLLNLMDKIVLEITSRRYWCEKQFKRDGSIKSIVGMPKEYGPYDAGLQEAGSNFGGVIQLSFTRKFVVEQEVFIQGTYELNSEK